jgi:hypothetical protein
MSSHNDLFAASGSSPTEADSLIQPDFLVENHFSIFLQRIFPVSTAIRPSAGPQRMRLH